MPRVMPAFADINFLCLNINIGASVTPGSAGVGAFGLDSNASIATPARARAPAILPAIACEQVSAHIHCTIL